MQSIDNALAYVQDKNAGGEETSLTETLKVCPIKKNTSRKILYNRIKVQHLSMKDFIRRH